MKITLVLALLFSVTSFAKVDEIRVYKQERIMELLEDNQVVKSYNIRLSIAHNNPFFKPGPKRLRGDNKTPEGNYKIIKKRQHTNYRKSLLINYPSKKDIEWGKKNGYSKYELGDLILIHGERKTPSKGVLNFAKKLGIEAETVDRWAKNYFYPFFDWTNGCVAVDEFEMDEIFELVDVNTPINIYKHRHPNLTYIERKYIISR